MYLRTGLFADSLVYLQTIISAPRHGCAGVRGRVGIAIQLQLSLSGGLAFLLAASVEKGGAIAQSSLNRVLPMYPPADRQRTTATRSGQWL
jgi:hypothetical protein